MRKKVKRKDGMKKLGERIRKLRKEQGMTQEELGKRIGGIPNNVISMIENDHREPDLRTLVAMADLFGVETDFLLGRTEYTGH